MNTLKNSNTIELHTSLDDFGRDSKQPVKQSDTIYSVLKAALHFNRNKKREEVSEKKRLQEQNKEYEEEIKIEIARIKTETESSL